MMLSIISPHVSHVWGWVRARLVDVLGNNSVSNWELINLLLQASSNHNEAVWLLGSYVSRTWEDIFVRGGA